MTRIEFLEGGDDKYAGIRGLSFDGRVCPSRHSLWSCNIEAGAGKSESLPSGNFRNQVIGDYSANGRAYYVTPNPFRSCKHYRRAYYTRVNIAK